MYAILTLLGFLFSICALTLVFIMIYEDYIRQQELEELQYQIDQLKDRKRVKK